jgi:L-asparaginase type I
MKQKVFVLTTGGTIGHRSAEGGVAVMDFDPEKLVFDLGFKDLDLEFKRIMQKGSMDITPDDWRTIAVVTADVVSEAPRGVVILHGTDTLHYTAAALSFMLRDLGLPVVLTGSMMPGGDVGSDSLANLRDAIHVAARSDLAEVCVVFSADLKRTKGVIIRGNRARKVHSCAINAFDSINVPPIGYVQDDEIVLTDLKTNLRRSSKLRLSADLELNVVLVKLTPAVSREMLAQNLRGAAGAVLEGTGIGHIKTDLRDVVVRFSKPIVISTQTVYGGERLGLYDVDRHILDIPNIIPVGDMNSDTALVKLMWALKQSEDTKSIMQSNIAGEIGASSPIGLEGR